MELEKRGIKICLFVEHHCEEMSNSIYMIEPPTDVVEYDEKQIDSDGFMTDTVSPVITFDKKGELLKDCAMVRLGSRIYLFGGQSIYILRMFFGGMTPPCISDELKVSVRFFEIDHPELGLRPAASFNAPKETPCVFTARGMIYVLGSNLQGCNLSGGVGTGIFERYDPTANKWVVLPDPPLPFGKMREENWCDLATVVRDRYVFLGNPLPMVYLIFDLDAEEWAPHLSPSSSVVSRFPYGSLCVGNSLYHLTGFGTWKYGTQFEAKKPDDEDDDDDHIVMHIVKRGPLFLKNGDPCRLLKSRCLRPENAQVMITLDHVALLTDMNSFEWRDIFHLGGRFFCYVVTSQLINCYDRTRSQPYCRGVWIDVFEEVELPAASESTRKESHFRTLASFSYRIRTPFHNDGVFIRCCAFGSVPDSWVKEPLKKKQVVKERKTLKAEQIQHEHGCGSKGQGDCNLEKIVAVAAGDEEIIRLKAELARKDALLKTYESLLAAA